MFTIPRLRLDLRALVLALAPGIASAQGPAGLPSPGDPAPAASAELPDLLALPPGPYADEASNLVRAGRHAEAAERLLVGFRSTGDTRFLYHACRRHADAGHNALALRCYPQWLARHAADDPARPHVEAQVAAAKSRVTPVRLRILDRRTGQPIPPTALARAAITARLLSATASAPVEFKLTGGDGEPLWLDPGAWSVQVRAPGYRPVELRRSPMWGADEETWDIVLAPDQVPLTLRVSPARALRDATLRLAPIDGAPAAPIERPLDRREQTLVLTGGAWQLDITARRHAAHQSLYVAAPMAPVDIKLRPTRARPRGRSFERDDKLMAGLGITLVSEAIIGAGLALAGGIKRGRAHDRNEALVRDALVDDATDDADGLPGLEHVEATYPTARYHRDLRLALDLETAGLAVLASGAAATIPALTVAMRARRRAGYIELGLGAAMLGGGATWLALALDRRNARLAADDPTERVAQIDLRPLVRHTAGAAILTGLGAGLTLFSSVALIRDARRHRRTMSAAPLAAPGLAGVLVRGRF